MYAGTFWAGVFKTTDGGGTWAPKNTGLEFPFGTAEALAVHPTAPSTVYASAGVMYKSTDAGESWVAISQVAKGVYGVGEIAIDRFVPSRLYVSRSVGGLYRSTDAGASWTPASFTPLWVYDVAVDPSVPPTLYIATSTGIYRSVNAGHAWTSILSTPLSVSAFGITIHPATPTTFYAAIQGQGVYRSTDSGMNWTPVNVGLATPVPRKLVIDPGGTSTVFAPVQLGSVWQASPPVPVELTAFVVE